MFCWDVWKQVWKTLDEFDDLLRIFAGVLEYMVTITTSFRDVLEVTPLTDKLLHVDIQLFSVCKQDDCVVPDFPAEMFLQLL